MIKTFLFPLCRLFLRFLSSCCASVFPGRSENLGHRLLGNFERRLYNSLKLLGWADKHEHIRVGPPDPPFALKLRNICLHLPSKLETQTASAAKHSLVHCRLPIWVTHVSSDGKSRALAVMQLADNTFPTILISCERFIHSE